MVRTLLAYGCPAFLCVATASPTGTALGDSIRAVFTPIRAQSTTSSTPTVASVARKGIRPPFLSASDRPTDVSCEFCIPQESYLLQGDPALPFMRVNPSY